MDFHTVVSLPPIHLGDGVLKTEARQQLGDWGAGPEGPIDTSVARSRAR